MNNHLNLKKRLEKFGLNDKQAAVYIHLITYGDSRINELAKALGIARTSIYELLKGLYKLGLAEEIIEGAYKRIRGYPIHSMRHDIDEQIQKLQGLTQEIDQLDRTLAKLPAGAHPHTSFVRYYEGRAGARQLLWNTLKADDTVYVFSSWGRGRYVGMNFYKSFVSESKEREITEKVLINPKVSTFESIKTYTGEPVARTNPNDIRMVDADDIAIHGETFIYNNIFAQVYLKGDVITGFEIESNYFVEFQKSIFETLWNSAKPLPF